MKGEHGIQMLCELLEVSRSGYYRWETAAASAREKQDEELADHITQAHAESRQNYGAPRIVAELKARDIKISKRRCARIMAQHGIRGKKKHRRRPQTTDSRHDHAPARNRLRHRAKPTAANQVWMTDIMPRPGLCRVARFRPSGESVLNAA